MINRLKVLRDSKNLSQSEIAKIFGISQSTYLKYEDGSLDIPGDLLKAIAVFYDTNIDYVLYITNIKKPYPRV